MPRKKSDAWGCGHPMPIEVVPLGDRRQARCLRCGQWGPVRPDSEEALRALRAEAAGRSEKIGA